LPRVREALRTVTQRMTVSAEWRLWDSRDRGVFPSIIVDGGKAQLVLPAGMLGLGRDTPQHMEALLAHQSGQLLHGDTERWLTSSLVYTAFFKLWIPLMTVSVVINTIVLFNSDQGFPVQGGLPIPSTAVLMVALLLRGVRAARRGLKEAEELA